MSRFDERDIIFSRMSLEAGSREYKNYYKRNPEKKEKDDKIRKMPGLQAENSSQYDPYLSPMASSAFKFLGDIKQYSEKNNLNTNKKIDITPEKASKKVKDYARYYGADLIGITRIRKELYYSHRGRKPHYGEKIKQYHKYGVVFAVEMDQDMIKCAPGVKESVEVTKGYVKAAVIGMMLSYYIREFGYKARNHMDGNYLLNAPHLAADAGLGEIGRIGLLVTGKFGPRVRLGIVSTDLELIPDKKANFGLQQFCNTCKACARNCPANAISAATSSQNFASIEWKIDADKCYKMWRTIGTDCGICLASCPFSLNQP